MVEKWNFEAEYAQGCNCDYGCPCNFNALPSHGNCESLVGYRVRKGRFGSTPLDGVTFAWGLWWPKAIHEGNGVARAYIDPKASPEQRRAVEEMLSGRHGGGSFEIWPRTFAKTFPMKATRIHWTWAGCETSFEVDGVGRLVSDYIRNPVTKAKFVGRVVLPGGFNWKQATATNIKEWRLNDREVGWDLFHRDVSGFVTVLRRSQKGTLSSRAP